MQAIDYEKHKPTVINTEGLTRFLASLRGDIHLTALVGGVMYGGIFGFNETPTGYHFTMTCPNDRTAKELANRAYDLYVSLEAIFPITRLVICTSDDPFVGSPPDNWQSQGFHVMPDGSYVGKAIVDYHPSWYILVKLNQKGRQA